MHSSSLCTARRSSHYWGVVGLHTPLEQAPLGSRTPLSRPPCSIHPLGADPPGVGLETIPQARSPSTSHLVVGLETPLARTPSTSPWVWAWKSARHAGIIPPPPSWRPAARYAGISPAMHAGIAAPHGQNNRHM